MAPKSNKSAPPSAPSTLGGKSCRFCHEMCPKWCPNEIKTEPELSKNRVRKQGDFCRRFFIVFGWFLGGKNGRKSSKIVLRRRSGVKTPISRKCWFYYSKTMVFEAWGAQNRGHFGEKIVSGVCRGAGSNKHSEQVRFLTILVTKTELFSSKNGSEKRSEKKSEQSAKKCKNGPPKVGVGGRGSPPCRLIKAGKCTI